MVSGGSGSSSGSGGAATWYCLHVTVWSSPTWSGEVAYETYWVMNSGGSNPEEHDNNGTISWDYVIVSGPFDTQAEAAVGCGPPVEAWYCIHATVYNSPDWTGSIAYTRYFIEDAGGIDPNSHATDGTISWDCVAVAGPYDTWQEASANCPSND